MYNSIHNTLIIGKKAIYLPSCHSTNDIAAELVRGGLFEEGTIVITDQQVHGRGQRGTTWVTNAGENLTFSVILAPRWLAVADQFMLSQIVALAICAYLSEYLNDVLIKWPNDIYAGNSKICGILIENSIQGTTISNSVIGIGLNVNQMEFGQFEATSIRKKTGNELTLTEELPKIVSYLDALYLQLRSGSHQESIRKSYLAQLYGYNKTVRFRHQGEEVEGIVTDVNRSGKLCVKFRNEARILEFGLKEIEWVL